MNCTEARDGGWSEPEVDGYTGTERAHVVPVSGGNEQHVTRLKHRMGEFGGGKLWVRGQVGRFDVYTADVALRLAMELP